MSKFIFITGGVVSSLGKGITAASIGQILKSRGLKVFMQKFDPYINVDPGTMSPYQHGEVFVTDDGAETDLDLGHYERFIDEKLSKDSSVTTGKIYQSVIDKERKGFYNGATIQVIPHITNEIKARLAKAAKNSKADIIITEIGGTVGDIESLPYLEAIRQARRDFGYHKTLYIHNTLVPYLQAANEIKTKPTQHSVSELKSLGIQPDILVLRSEKKVSEDAKDKIAAFSDLKRSAVFESLDVDILYKTIIKLEEQKIDEAILKHFKMNQAPKADLTPWNALIERISKLDRRVKIAIVGKYVSLQDAYLSIVESLKHSGYHHNVIIDIKWVNAEELDDNNIKETLEDCKGIIIPGGFGKRATDGKIAAIKYARENNVPMFGICFGMQLTVVEYAQNVLGLKGAHSVELDKKTPYPVIVKNENATMVLGGKNVVINDNTKLAKIYGTNTIVERHRHRYSFNMEYLETFKNDENIVLSAFNEKSGALEAVELRNHKWFVAVQYHPEFLSRPLKPHPLFNSFIESVIN
ncbi:MAG: CTP synthase [Acholeplasma sp.]|nr:CTP synthase [Acholeplasma sp.]